MDERRLVARADLRLEPGVIGQRRPAGRGDLLGDLLGLVAARRIDDARARLARRASALQLLADACRAGGHDSGCSAGRNRRRSAPLRGCRAGPGCRRGCARSAVAVSASRGTSAWSSSRAEQPIIGPEIVAPFADAMRFVDRDQRQRSTRVDQPAEAVERRALGRDIEQVELAALKPLDRLARGRCRPRSATPRGCRRLGARGSGRASARSAAR